MSGQGEASSHVKLAQEYGHGTEIQVNDDPGPFSYIWEWFIDLNRQRHFDGAAGAPLKLTWSDILAWSTLLGTPLGTHELRLIQDMDELYVREAQKAVSQRAKTTRKKAR